MVVMGSVTYWFHWSFRKDSEFLDIISFVSGPRLSASVYRISRNPLSFVLLAGILLI